MTAEKLPYLTSPGTVDNVLPKVKAAATPPKFNNDFVHTKLQIKGGTGKALPPLFKKLGLVGDNGSPTKLYEQLRNDATAGAAIAAAMRTGYKPLYDVNEYCHDLSDKDLKGLVLQVTGLEDSNRAVDFIKRTFLRLKKHADFETELSDKSAEPQQQKDQGADEDERSELDVRIGYTINLNLPPSTNPEVFDAIFQSLRRNLLR